MRSIVNGIDTARWNPETDPALAAHYNARIPDARKVNKRALEQHFGLDKDDGPLFLMVSRLSRQKGIDVICEVLDFLVGNGARLAILGSGDAETQLCELAHECVPEMNRTGGLADTVIDANPAAPGVGAATGVQFDGAHYHGLAAAFSRAIALYRQPDHWQQIQRNGVAADCSWRRSGAQYAAIYQQLAGANP